MADSAKRVVMITGATGGLGSELASACSLAGWEPILIGRNRKKLEQLYDRIVQAGGAEPTIHVMDFAAVTPGDCADLVEAVQQEYHGLDALVHCAVAFDGLQPLDQIAPDDWLRKMQINVNTPWLLTVACLPLLRQRVSASVAFLAEDLEKIAGAYWGVYGVSKWSLNTLAAQLTSELTNSKIRVLSIDPGPMRTSLRAGVYHSESPEEVRHPREIAAKILDLLNDDGKVNDFRVKLGG